MLIDLMASAGWLWGLTGVLLATFSNLGIVKQFIQFIPYIYLFFFIEFLIFTYGIIHSIKFLYNKEKEYDNFIKESITKRHHQQKRLVRKLKLEVFNKTKKLVMINKKLRHSLENLKKAQNQLVKSQRLITTGTLLSGIAHEIKNPLNFMRGYNEVIKDIIKQLQEYSFNDSEYLRILNNLEFVSKKIEYGITRIDNLVNHFRKFLHPEEVNITRIDVIYCIESALLSFPQNYLKEVHIERFYENIPAIRGNTHVLKQAFINIFMNSLQAMNYQGVLQISVTYFINQILVTICDTGKGIPKELQKKIFEPFFSTKQDSISTGLGLPIAEIIIKQHHGELFLLKSDHKGTCFQIILKIT